MGYGLIAKGLFEAGKLGLKKFAKRQAKKIPKQKVESAKQKLDKAKTTTMDATKRTGKFTKDMFTVPRTGPLNVQRRLRDRGLDALNIASAAEVPLAAYDAYGKLTDPDRDFSTSDALILGGSLIAGGPLYRSSVRSARRLNPFRKTTRGFGPSRDKKGDKYKNVLGEKTKVASGIEMQPMGIGRGKSAMDKLESPLLLGGLGAGLTGVGIKGVSALRGPEALPEAEGMPELKLSEPEKEFGNLVEKQIGPNEKAALEMIEQRKGTAGKYSPEQENDILSVAQQQDKALETQTADKETTTPGEAAEGSGGGEQPPGGETPEAGDVAKGQPEVNIDKNPGTAVTEADKSATTVLQSDDNPTGKRITDPDALNKYPPITMDIGGVQLRAEFKKKDFEGTKKAMEKYQEYLDGKRDKRMTFEDYQKKYSNLTGDFSEEKNLAMFKWAMAMMTGRSNEQGLSGFLDIVGQAGLVYSDDVQAIMAQERAEKRDLVASFMMYDQDLQKFLDSGDLEMLNKNIALSEAIANEEVDSQNRYIDRVIALATAKAQIRDIEARAMKNKGITSKRQIGYVYDENYYNNKRPVELGIDSTSGERVIIEVTPQGEVFKPITQDVKLFGNGDPIPPARVAKTMSQLAALDQGVNFADIVINASEAGIKLGSVGFYNNVVTNLTDLLDDWGTSMGVLNEGVSYKGSLKNVSASEISTAIDGSVREMLIMNAGYKGYVEGTPLDEDKRRKTSIKLLQKYDEDQKQALQDAQDILDGTKRGKSLIPKAVRGEMAKMSASDRSIFLSNLAKLRLIENRMKYIVANANKGEDRLTVADVIDAAGTTTIFGLTYSDTKVRKNYESLRNTLNQRATTMAKLYVDSGGAQDLLDNFKSLDYVQRKYIRTGKRKEIELQERLREAPSRELFGVLNVEMPGQVQ